LEFAQLQRVDRAFYRKSQILGHDVRPVTLSKISPCRKDISSIKSSATLIFLGGCVKHGVRNLSYKKMFLSSLFQIAAVLKTLSKPFSDLCLNALSNPNSVAAYQGRYYHH
jgi:hypothetical protein